MDEIDAQTAEEPAGEPSGAPSPEPVQAGENPQALAAAGSGLGPIHAMIEIWWHEHFPGSAVARYTDAWNVAYSAKEALKRLLAVNQEK